MSTLTDEQRASCRARLESHCLALEQRLAELRGETQPVALELPIGRLSRMDAIQQQSMASGHRGRVEVELAKARQALRRLDDGTYGYCLRCQDPMAYERLRIHPGSTLCLGCQEAIERNHHRGFVG